MEDKNGPEYGEVALFFSKKWKNWDCERCGTALWELGEEYQQRVGALVTPSNDGSYSIPGSGTAEVVTIICTNCGNVRLTAKKVILKWIEELEAKSHE